MKIFFFLWIVGSLYGFYDPLYENFSQKIQKPDAVAIIAYNRPSYLKQLLDSLEKTAEAQTLPFFFFLDGGDPEAQSQNKKWIDDCHLASKIILSRETNFGCPKNHIDAKRFLFDWCAFSRVVVLEEDLLISPNYFNTLFQLDNWAHRHYANIGTVQLWNKKKSKKSKKQNAKVQETLPPYSLVTYCIRRDVWNAISPLLYTYETQCIDPLLKEDPKIRSKPQKGPTSDVYQQWISSIAKTTIREESLKKFPSDRPLWTSRLTLKRWTQDNQFFMNQDQITTLALWLTGHTRLQTKVSRVQHIGKVGISGEWDIEAFNWNDFPEDPRTLDLTFFHKPLDFRRKHAKIRP